MKQEKMNLRCLLTIWINYIEDADIRQEKGGHMKPLINR